MPTIQSTSFSDLLASLNDWSAFSPNQSAALFIGAVGFEERSSKCFETWCASVRGRGARAILVRYPFNRKDDQAQSDLFTSLASAAGVTILEIEYTKRNIFPGIIASLQAQPANSVLIDLSSLASFVLFPLFAAVLETLPKADVRVCYSEASNYFPSCDEWEEFQKKVHELDLFERARLFDEKHFQSDGVDNVFECPPFIGHNPNNLPTTPILVPNFSFERVNRMIDYVADHYSAPRERCEWIIGVPPDREKNGWRHDAIWQMFDRPKAKHEASTLHYKEMLLVLHELWEKQHHSASFAIVTVGSKAQHLATFLFLTMHPDTVLVLSEPHTFMASRYSEGTDSQWQLDLGVIGELAGKLIGWNSMQFIW